jgi:hypothetical protein
MGHICALGGLVGLRIGAGEAEILNENRGQGCEGRPPILPQRARKVCEHTLGGGEIAVGPLVQGAGENCRLKIKRLVVCPAEGGKCVGRVLAPARDQGVAP